MTRHCFLLLFLVPLCHARVATLFSASPLLQTPVMESSSSQAHTSELLMQLMGMPSSISETPSTLPTTDIFKRPRLGVTVVIGDAEQGPMSSTFSTLLKNIVGSNVPVHSTAVLEQSKATQAGVLESFVQPVAARLASLPAEQKGSVSLMVSGDDRVASSVCPACLRVTPNAQGKDSLAFRIENGGSMLEGVAQALVHAAGKYASEVESASRVQQHKLWGALLQALAQESVPTSQPEIEALQEEMDLFQALPSMLQHATLQDDASGVTGGAHQLLFQDDLPDLVTLVPTSVQGVRAIHGEASPISVAAAALENDVVGQLLASFEAIHPGRVLHQLLVTHDAAQDVETTGDASHARGRRLLTADTESAASTASPVMYTSSDVNTYQIKLWTMVVLVLVILAGFCGFAAMDTPLDPMLRVKISQDDNNKQD